MLCFGESVYILVYCSVYFLLRSKGFRIGELLLCLEPVRYCLVRRSVLFVIELVVYSCYWKCRSCCIEVKKLCSTIAEEVHSRCLTKRL